MIAPGDGTASSNAAVREGDVLAGKYRVERVLGIGGMGTVVAAEHLQLDQKVALKTLLPTACEQPEAVARFLREARASVQIKGEHVARIIDVGTLESGAPFLVMELLTGTDLSALLAARGPLPIEEAVDYVLQACEAIAEAHTLGIVHRDLKPSNLFLTERADGSPLVKVLDFGISKALLPGASPSMTTTASVFGSPAYMSPEQVRSAKNVDKRTDLWALGVILFELLTARQIYEADNVTGLLAAIIADPSPSLRAFRPDAPEGLEQVILRCLEKDVNRRVQTVAELVRLLAPFAAPQSQISVHRVVRMLARSTPDGDVSSLSNLSVPERVQGPPPHSATAAPWTATGPVKKLRTPKILAIGAAVLLCGAAAIVFAVTRARTAADDATASVAAAAPPEASTVFQIEEPPPVVTAIELVGPAASTTASATPPSTDRLPARGEKRPKPAQKGGTKVDPLMDRR